MDAFTVPSREAVVPRSRPVYERPVELACFSFNGRREQSMNRSQLKQYKPHLNKGFCNSSFADLNAGRREWIEKPQKYQDHLDPIIATLRTLPKTEKVADFVLWRGMLTKIMMTPFKTEDKWSFNIMRRGKTIYLEYDKEFDTGQCQNSRALAATYWGHRFESMVLCPIDSDPSFKERYDEPVNTWAEFSILVKTKLGKHRLLFAAEVDGVDERGDAYIECKTTAAITDHHSEQRFFQNKLISYWAQSFVAGVDKLLIGYRTPNGIIKSVNYMRVSDIPRMVRGRVSWCPESMLNFLTMTLDWLAQVMPSKPDDFVFQMVYSGEGQIQLIPKSNYPVFVPADFEEASYC